MARPEKKKPGNSQGKTRTKDISTRPNAARTPTRKDPDEYDPVGMAGKPAGILLELGQQEAREKAKGKMGLAKEKTGGSEADL